MSQEQEARRFFRLETAASLAGVSAGRVRTYMRCGFVRPARVEGRRLLFGEPELARIRQIRRMADDLGLNLAGIDVTLNLLNEITRLRGMIAEHHQQSLPVGSNAREREPYAE